jgi:hypothetical protein
MRAFRILLLAVVTAAVCLGVFTLSEGPAFAGITQCPPTSCYNGCYNAENYCVSDGYSSCLNERLSCEAEADIAYNQCLNQGKSQDFCEGQQQSAYDDCWSEYQSCRTQVNESCAFERNLCLDFCDFLNGC